MRGSPKLLNFVNVLFTSVLFTEEARVIPVKALTKAVGQVLDQSQPTGSLDANKPDDHSCVPQLPTTSKRGHSYSINIPRLLGG